MKTPSKYTRTIVKEYWDCGIPSHSHLSYDVASNCIAKQMAKKTRRDRNDWTDRRKLTEVIRLREDDRLTFREIGERFGCGPNQARQVYLKAKRVSKMQLNRNFANIADLATASASSDPVTR